MKHNTITEITIYANTNNCIIVNMIKSLSLLKLLNGNTIINWIIIWYTLNESFDAIYILDESMLNSSNISDTTVGIIVLATTI